MIRRFCLWGAEEEEVEETEEIVPGIPSTKELTAEEIEKMTARAADRAQRKARKDLASELGFSDLSQMKEFITAKLEADKAAMDEKDRAIKEAESARAEAETLRSNLVSDRLDTAVLRQVIANGVTEERKLSRITALIRLDLDPDIINDEDSWEEAITAALSAVKEDAPELFSGSKQGFGSGDGGARGPSEVTPDTEAERNKKFEEQYAAKGFIKYEPDNY